MTYPVILGLDPGTKRIGYGAVRADTGAPVTCGAVEISKVGWFDQSVRNALADVAQLLPADAEVVDLVVEQMSGGGGGLQSQLTLADAAGQITQAASRRWGLAAGRRRPSAWKKAVGLKGNCAAMYAVPKAQEIGFHVPKHTRGPVYFDIDAAAAACIAKAAWIEADREAA